ncbi:hypothetical protein FQN57_002727 [Myotisia sp. PD_48]|nr:hypothetical protein FQN57_002727 [Myotisia sp. PD_48]
MLRRRSPPSRPMHDFFRQATYILSATGQRIRGVVYRDQDADARADERSPLLSQTVPDTDDIQTSPRRWKGVSAIINTSCAFMQSETGKGVLKCSLAYLIGSLATFVPVLSNFLGQQDGKHTVATVTVYFHPARTRGSMLEALIFAFIACVYAAFISITSMSVSVLFEDVFHLLPLGHAIVLIVFCGGGLGLIGWVKQRRGDPLVNVACSLASLAIITVLTKEGAVQRGDLSFAKIDQVFKMVIMGTITTMAVCFLIYPISAKKKLRESTVDMTDSLSDMVEILTESFVYGAASTNQLEQKTFIDATTKSKTAYSNMETLLKEAKFEHYIGGTENEFCLERKLVRSLQDIAQSIGGLRSAAALQFELLKQTCRSCCGSESTLDQPNIFSPPPGAERLGMDWRTNNRANSFSRSSMPDPGSDDDSQPPSEIVDRFIYHLGPSMRSLAFTLKEILESLPYGPGPDYKITINPKFRTSLDRALELYSSSRNDALNLIYSQKDLMVLNGGSLEYEADLEEVAASCGHFSFSLQELGEQLKEFLEILDKLQLEVEERPNGRSWNWLKPWKRKPADCDEDLLQTADDALKQLHGPESRDSVASNIQARTSSLRYKIWKALRLFRRDDTKFAVKVGVGAALYALPSFLKATRPIYSTWRGEWGLLSYMLVCSMTIGASNTTGYARFFGTCFGAACAIAAWRATDANVYLLAVIGWAMSLWTAYVILAQKKGPMGRFIMLTYNLTVLYAYSLSRNEGGDDEDEGGESPIVTDIALHRVVAVLSGIIWGIIITRVIWPSSARRKLKDGISVLWLRMSVIWKRDPLSTMIQEGSTIPYFDVKEKITLQLFLNRLDSLRTSAQSEFSLKRPFPDDAYNTLLIRTGRMLDAFQAMNLEIMKNLTASEGEAAMLKYTLHERMQLSARISHLLSVLASSMRLGYSLNDVLPDTEHARDRLLARLHHFRSDKSVSHLTTDEDYALLNAYILVTAQLSNEITDLMDQVRDLFGTIDEDAITLF